jgi:hypothetical protein
VESQYFRGRVRFEVVIVWTRGTSRRVFV